MTLQNLLNLNVITKYMFCTIVNNKGMVIDKAPYRYAYYKLKSLEVIDTGVEIVLE